MKDFPGEIQEKELSGLFEAKFSFGQGRFLEAFHLGEQFSFQAPEGYFVAFTTIIIAQLVGILLQVIEPGTVKA
jgi:hypothetical protein